ncbi:tetratricopeptide repeat protein [Limnobacter parvus]|uniref:Tetratricopeptide repeat protein n=1 Tax=Limnobacter parvus TaxID=2939690 RepID=A0ABT1XK64_9BURK|nr:tetratricopeptide repeat protein [Limnobacter parvus]MCR2746943.1 tetratricopeptide repeat protein [Limnobacter parvus]
MMTTTSLTSRKIWTVFCFTFVVLLFPAQAHSSTQAEQNTRCETSFGKDPVITTVETCRLELAGPVTRAKRIAILETLGKAYLAQNEADLAISTWHEASQYTKPDRNDLATAESWTRLQVLIGQTYAQADQLTKAEAQFKKTLNTVEQSIGRYSLPAGIAQDAMGTYYALQNKPEEAETAFKQSRIVYEIRLGKLNARTLETRMNHAVGLLDMGKEAEALENFQVLGEIINTSPQYEKAPIRAEILTFLGTLQMRGDQLQSAIGNYKTAYEVREAAFGPNDIRTSQSLNNLGVVLYRAGDLNRAEIALSKAYVIRNDSLGGQDPLTLSTQRNLQAVIAAQNAAKNSTLSSDIKRK